MNEKEKAEAAALAKAIFAKLQAAPVVAGDVIVFACKPTQLRTIAPGSRKPKGPPMTHEEARAVFGGTKKPRSAARPALAPMLDGVAHVRWEREVDFAVAVVAAAFLGEVSDFIAHELTGPPTMIGPYGDLHEVPSRWLDAMAGDDAAVERAVKAAPRDTHRIRELAALARQARGAHKRLYVWSSRGVAARDDE